MFLIKSFENFFWKVYLYSVFKIVPKNLYFICIIIINKNTLLFHEAPCRYFQIHFCENFIFMCVIEKEFLSLLYNSSGEKSESIASRVIRANKNGIFPKGQ